MFTSSSALQNCCFPHIPCILHKCIKKYFPIMDFIVSKLHKHSLMPRICHISERHRRCLSWKCDNTHILNLSFFWRNKNWHDFPCITIQLDSSSHKLPPEIRKNPLSGPHLWFDLQQMKISAHIHFYSSLIDIFPNRALLGLCKRQR